jgi:membrane-bound lytic murein transglycosylase D
MQLYRLINKLKRSCVFLMFSLLFANLYAQPIDDSWDKVRRKFSLDHHLAQAEVQQQLRWILSHPKYLNKLSQAKPYIYHILTEIEKRNLPGELVLIPMLESAYNPFAYSGAGAAGLWQLMPKTGKNLGVNGDWWEDERRSIAPSTNAALNYFRYLNHFFHGDWLLAIAAYDCGEGTVQRQLKQKRPQERQIWYLPLPQETQVYVPRLLALAEIIANPNKYGVKLPYIPHKPYFKEVYIGSQIDLSHAARLAGISYQDLLKLNPGFNHWSTSPKISSTLLLPAHTVESFHQNLAKTPKHSRASFIPYQVKSGDSLSSIAYRFHTNVNLIAQINHLQGIALKPGKILNIPSTQTAQISPRLKNYTANHQIIAPKFYKVLHIVQANENLAKIETRYRVSKNQILAWNNMKNASIQAGQKLIIWRQTNGNPYYIVKNGDTFNQIANLHHLNANTLYRLNPEKIGKTLHPGDKIRIV